MINIELKVILLVIFQFKNMLNRMNLKNLYTPSIQVKQFDHLHGIQLMIAYSLEISVANYINGNLKKIY